MQCLNCSGYNTMVFFTEVMECSHCHENNEISYTMCQDCGLVWKSIDGQPISGMVFSESELTGFMDEGFSDFLDSLNTSNLDVQGTMSDIVHKCLKCNTTSFEVKPGFFHCPECGFEWEMI